MVLNKKESLTGLEIAVIGMTGRFPGATNLEEFWDNLKNGIESISFFSDQELENAGVDPVLLEDTHYVKAKGILEDVEFFDSSFFGHTPIEGEVMDPQIRIFHECAWQALEDAGYAPGTYKGRIGLYAGASSHLRWEVLSIVSGKSDALGQFASWQLYDKDFISTRVSYKLDLSGPSINVQTACSTSLVAVHLACQGLLSGECQMALAGGITISIPPKKGYLYQEGMILSPDGHCRTFDARAKGTIFSEGVGIVVLKSLERAIADRDLIYAVIKGSAINNDGSGKVGYTAPGVKGQAAVIRRAHRAARVNPGSISYIETHGTATNLGDPTEVEALKQAFNTDKKEFCRIGSVKSNIGHLDNAAGIVGFIKTVLALKYRSIPPTLHFEKCNPKIDFQLSPFVVNKSLVEWKSNGFSLRAAVSSFGAGGTNAHVILEEAPEVTKQLAKGSWQREKDETHAIGGRKYQLIFLSAKTETALERMTTNLAEYLRKNPGVNIGDVAYTLQVGRQAFEYQRMLVCRDSKEAAEALANPQPPILVKTVNNPVIFMFPGQGTQYVNMGLDLYRTEPVFREEMDRCFEILESLMDYNIKEILYPGYRYNKSYTSDESLKSQIKQTEIAQPLIFAVEYALSKLLMNWGLKPYSMIGHSIGEYTAACLAGVFSLENALEIVALRGRLMQQMPPGAMIGVSLSPGEIFPLLTPGVSLAAVNTPRFCVVSGSYEAIDNFSTKIKKRGHEARLLHTSHAFHSKMMEPILNEFEKKISQVTGHEPRIPYISNLTGNWIRVEDAASPQYWAKHLREPVLFSDGLTELLKKTDAVFLDIGPGKALSTFARQHPGKKPGHIVLDLLRHPKQEEPDDRFLLDKISRLWFSGVKLDWTGFYSTGKRHRISLPTYSFERLHYPVAGDPFKFRDGMLSNKPRLEKRKEITDWFYVPSWEKSIPSSPPPVEAAGQSNWLVFTNAHGLGTRLIRKFAQDEEHMIIVKAGSAFSEKNEGEFTINPGQENDYERLFDVLYQVKKVPRKILHLWNVTGNKEGMHGIEGIDRILETGFYSLLHIARAIGRQGITDDIQIVVVTDNMQEVTGEEEQCPGKATLLGAVKVISLEYPNIRCRSVDIVLPQPGSPREGKLLDNLALEFTSNFPDSVVAYRGNFRWVPIIKPFPIEKPGEEKPLLREEGVYLITGGLGGIGLTLSVHLAKSVRARLILTGRSFFPARDKWEEWLSTHDDRDRINFRIGKLLEIEKSGGEVMVICADVSSPEQMQDAIALAHERFGRINGVIHSAGIPDGGIIQARTQEMTEKVFAPKVKGTLVLDHILKEEPLDFFVLCSSLSSILPPFGQVAYSAANAFQDAFALYKASNNGHVYIVSINWDTWKEVGMAVEAVQKRTGAKDLPDKPLLEVPHPLFDFCLEKNSNEKIYITRFSVNKHWVLDEHRLLGRPTLPGTALVEMMRAAFEHHTGKDAMEINEITFLTPFRMIDENGEKEVRTILRKERNGYKVIISSRLDLSADQWVEHARGEVSAPGKAEIRSVKKYDLDKIIEKCNEGEVIVTREMLETDAPQGALNMVFGRRWENLKKVNYQANQVLLLLELPGEFAGDIGVYKLHPALLDIAVGFYERENTSREASLPFSYTGIKIKAPLPRRIYSYLRYDEKNREEEQFVKYSITIMDEEGQELVDIEEYRRLTVSDDAMERISNEVSISPVPDSASTPVKEEEEFLKHGLLPSEGIEAFRRIMGRRLHQVLVSTIDFAARAEAAGEVNKSNLLTEFPPGKSREPLRPRPGLKKVFVAPANEMEKKITQIWQQFLGIEQIGINDNFFELGGDSLMLVQVNSQLEKILGKDMLIATLYDNPTIKSLSEYLSRGEMKPGISREGARRLKEKKKKGKTTLKQRKKRREGLKHES